MESKKPNHRQLKSIAGRIPRAQIKIKDYIDSVANDKQNVFFDSLGVGSIWYCVIQTYAFIF